MRKTIKTSMIVLLTSFLSICTAGCDAKNVSYNPPLPTGQADDYKQYLGETFNSTADLSDCQGYRNWYYYCGDPDNDTLAYMVFNDFYGRWCSKYQQLYTSTYIWGTAWLPEGQQGYGIGMGFKAPATGKVDVSVTVRLLAYPEFSNGDGVVFTVSDKTGEPYDGISISKQNGAKDYSLEITVDVDMGEEILFMLFANANNTHDYTNVDITINYIGE